MDEATDKLWNYALNLLSRRAYSEAQVSRKLVGRGASEEQVAEVLGKLREYRLVDDHLYAEMLVREQSRNKGEFAIRQSLFQKGIGEELAAQALQPLSEERQLASARRLLEKNRWRFSGEDGRRNRARAFSFLARRGFPSEIVLQVIEELPGE